MLRFLFLLACAAITVQGAIPIAKNGRAAAEIILPAEADPTMKFAADELQLWFREISGAEIPVTSAAATAGTRLILSTEPQILDKFPEDAKKLAGTDGYAVRTDGNTVYLIAAKSKGVLNGVYRMLYRNTDIIWARPDAKFGTIYTKNPDLTLSDTDYIDIPVFKLRGWQTIGDASNLWQVRNANNWNAENPENPTKRKHGLILEFGSGHNLTQIYIPKEKYWESHPEFYPLLKGKRTPPGKDHKTQLCFTNENMTEEFLRRLDSFVLKNPDYETYRIMIEDNWDQCECPSCRAPIALEGGKELVPTDKNYYSTRFFIWLNQIANHMEKNYPGKRILTFAYFFTEIPPAVKVSPIIDISFCPIEKNSKFPVYAKQNEETLTNFKNWIANTKNVTWREYYGLTGGFPHPVDATALEDWKYVHRFGVNKTYSELCGDDPGIIFFNYGRAGWDANALYFWVMTNGSWNPYRDVKELRNEFLTRVFGPAAGDVRKYYELLEEAWLKSPEVSKWNDRETVSWQNVLRTNPRLETDCMAALEQARKKEIHPNGRIILEKITANFQHYVGKSSVAAYRAPAPPKFDPEFATGAWAAAKPITEFTKNGSEQPYAEETSVKMLYDDVNLYFGITCKSKSPGKMYFRPPAPGENIFPDGEGFEIFLSGKWNNKDGYVQMVVDPSGNRYWSFGSDKRWNGKWHSEAQTTPDGWSAMVTISWQELGLSPADTKSLRGMFVRQYRRQPSPGSAASEAAQTPRAARHRLDTFAEIRLQ